MVLARATPFALRGMVGGNGDAAPGPTQLSQTINDEFAATHGIVEWTRPPVLDRPRESSNSGGNVLLVSPPWISRPRHARATCRAVPSKGELRASSAPACQRQAFVRSVRSVAEISGGRAAGGPASLVRRGVQGPARVYLGGPTRSLHRFKHERTPGALRRSRGKSISQRSGFPAIEVQLSSSSAPEHPALPADQPSATASHVRLGALICTIFEWGSRVSFRLRPSAAPPSPSRAR